MHLVLANKTYMEDAINLLRRDHKDTPDLEWDEQLMTVIL